VSAVTTGVRAHPVAPRQPRRKPFRPSRAVLYAFLTVTALLWLAPILWALYTSLRPYSDTQRHGYVSIAHKLGFGNYTQAWRQGDMARHFLDSLYITVPAVLLTLLLASFVAFTVSRFSFWFNIPLLIVFTAGNLLPQQVIITPLYRLFLAIPLPGWLSDSESLYDSFLGLILINVAFQVGFCTFVLSNYMKTLPSELTEAALVDGASVWRQYWQIVLPLCRPALAALATLEVTWIYNDFFWAIVLMSTGDKFPITSSLNNLRGEFFTDNNLVAAGSLLVAIPTLVVYFVLQRQFISGLTLGANKS
jgi:multiple sugar transport system permease protein